MGALTVAIQQPALRIRIVNPTGANTVVTQSMANPRERYKSKGFIYKHKTISDAHNFA